MSGGRGRGRRPASAGANPALHQMHPAALINFMQTMGRNDSSDPMLRMLSHVMIDEAFSQGYDDDDDDDDDDDYDYDEDDEDGDWEDVDDRMTNSGLVRHAQQLQKSQLLDSISEADNLFTQKKFSNAIPILKRIDADLEVVDFIPNDKKMDIRGQLALSFVHAKHFDDAFAYLESNREILTKHRNLMITAMLTLDHRRHYSEAIIFAIRGQQLFPKSEVFAKYVKKILALKPKLISEVESLKSNPPDLDRIFSSEYQANNNAEDIQPSPNNSRVSKELWIMRTANCLKKNKFRLASQTLKNSPKLGWNASEETMMNYCSIMIEVNNNLQDINLCYEHLQALKNENPKFIEVYYGLAQIQQKLKLMDEAEATIRIGLEKISSTRCVSFPWPLEWTKFFPESNFDIFEALLRKQLNLIITKEDPSAICRLKDCLHEAENGLQPAGREIYEKDFYTVQCTEKCQIEFHPACWKKEKEMRPPTSTNCVTPDCEGLIQVISFHRDGKSTSIKDPILAITEKELAAKLNAKKEKKEMEARLAEKKKEKEKMVKPKQSNQEQVPSGAIPKTKGNTTVNKRSAFNQKLTKFNNQREDFQKEVAKVLSSGEDKSLHTNSLRMYLGHLSKGDHLIAIDDSAIKASNLARDARSITDDIRGKLIENIQEAEKKEMNEFEKAKLEVEKIREEEKKRQDEINEMNEIKRQVREERELNFYLYHSYKKHLSDHRREKDLLRQELEQMQKRVVDLEMKIKNHQCAPQPNRASSTIVPRAPNQNQEAPTPNNSLQDLLSKMGLPPLATPVEDEVKDDFLDDPCILQVGDHLGANKDFEEKKYLLLLTNPEMSELEAEETIREYEREEEDKLDDAPTLAMNELEEEDEPSEDELEAMMEAYKQKQKATAQPPQSRFIPPIHLPPPVFVPPPTMRKLEECSICYDEIMPREEFKLKPCMHAYHEKCVKPWLQKENATCPNCRKHILLEEDYPSLY